MSETAPATGRTDSLSTAANAGQDMITPDLECSAFQHRAPAQGSRRLLNPKRSVAFNIAPLHLDHQRPRRHSPTTFRSSSSTPLLTRSIRSLRFALVTILSLSFLLFSDCAAASEYQRSRDLRLLALDGPLLVDHRTPPAPRMWLEKRADTLFSIDPSGDDVQPSSTRATSSSESATATSSESLTFATETETPSPLPQPFDTSLGSNFTSESCPTFFKTFLSDPNFQSCLPFSLLLQVSRSIRGVSRILCLTTRDRLRKASSRPRNPRSG